ncbi:MAG: hypothetical protein WDM71_03875 [Ferruginibacter sp.]
MEQREQQELIKEYQDREVRWTDKSLSQLSFFNNLLLTLSVGFLSFAYKEFSFSELRFNIKSPNWSLTFIAFSILFALFSIIVGLLVAINRLYDFRLTRQINQIRHRMVEHSKEKMSESSPMKFDYLRRLILPFQVMINMPTITMKECKEFHSSSTDKKQEIKCRFKELRNIAHNLGLNSWRKTNFQILYFALSVLLYVLGQLSK